MTEAHESDRFFKAVLELNQANLAKSLGTEDGREAFNAYYTILKKSFEMGGIPEDLLDGFRASNLTVEEAALAHLDACVTEAKRWLRRVGPRAAVDRVIALLETGIDRIFLASIGRIVPRNGSVGRDLDDFTREV